MLRNILFRVRSVRNLRKALPVSSSCSAITNVAFKRSGPQRSRLNTLNRCPTVISTAHFSTSPKKIRSDATDKEKLPFLRSSITLQLNINNKTLPFPLVDRLLMRDKWHGSEERAPFLNRDQLLYSMLNAAFENWSGHTPKRRYVVQGINRGSGRSRLQVEWIYQALNNARVIAEFLAKETSQLTNKKMFINALYEAAFTQRIILTCGYRMKAPDEKKEPDALRSMMNQAIRERFLEQDIKLESTSIDGRSLDKFTDNNSFGKHVELFHSLIDKCCKAPANLPFDDVKQTGKKLLILGLDTSQDYSSVVQNSTEKEDLVYSLLKSTANEETNCKNTSLFWVVTGQFIPGRFVNSGEIGLIKASMDTLLNSSCLNSVAIQYFNKALPLPGVNANMKILANETAKALVQSYFRTFGVPEVIAEMVHETYHTLSSLEKLIAKGTSRTSKETTELKSIRSNKNEVFKGITDVMRYLFPIRTRADMIQHMDSEIKYEKSTKHAMDLLDIKAALCLPQKIKDPIPHLQMTPQKLEYWAYLIQWKKINEEEKCYTRLFMLDMDSLSKPVPLLTYPPSSSNSWKSVRITLATLILHPNLFPETRKDVVGFEFDQATAASIYARYIAGKESGGKLAFGSVVSCDDLPQFLQDAEVHFRGVVLLNDQQQQDNESLLNEIYDKQVIAIAPKSHTSFGNITIPVTSDRDGVKEKAFICLQTTQYHGTLNLDVLATKGLKILEKHSCYLVGFAAQQSAKEELLKAIEEMIIHQITRPAAPEEFVNTVRTLLDKQSEDTMQSFIDRDSVFSLQQSLEAKREEVINVLERMLVLLKPEQVAKMVKKEMESVKTRVFTLPADAILSPIYQTYFGFASIFGDEELAVQKIPEEPLRWPEDSLKSK